jgi:hypothetical protein
MMRSLFEVLAEVPDWRKVSGRLYELVGVLLLVFLPLLSGQNNIRQIAARDRAQRWTLSRKLGFKPGRMPAYSTIRRVMVKIDPTMLEGATREWVCEVESLLGEVEKSRGVSIDGKTVRGSGEDGPARELLNAMAQETRWVLSQMAVPVGSSERGIIPEFLETLVLEGRKWLWMPCTRIARKHRLF